MKKGTFKGLLFQEFYTDKKTYFYNVLAFLIITLLCLLGLLSFKFGNLGKYEHLMPNEMKPLISFILKYYPLLGTFSIIPHKPYNSEKPMWKYFRRACPVPPYRLALASYCYLIIGMLVCGVISSAWLGLYSLLTGNPITAMDWISILGLWGFMLISTTLSQIAKLFVKSEEYAALLTVIIIAIVFVIGFIKFPLEMTSFMSFEWVVAFTEWCTSHIPVIIAIAIPSLLGSLLVGFGCTTIILGRREK